jgi:hypothetical protein
MGQFEFAAKGHDFSRAVSKLQKMSGLPLDPIEKMGL